ncbi:MAG: deoxyribodipyrimidine photo-lyase [bacterium]
MHNNHMQTNNPQIFKDRIQLLNNRTRSDGEYVIYWMQQSRRAEDNHALEYGVKRANELNKPLLTVFVLTDFPDANARHYRFMLEGIIETAERLRQRGIVFKILRGDPEVIIPDECKSASLLITDRGYLRIQRQWRKSIAQSINIPMFQIESDAVVPVESASDKEEYAAYTIRKNIMNEFAQYLQLPQKENVNNKREWKDAEYDIEDLLETISMDKSVKFSIFDGGEDKALEVLKDFMENNIEYYSELSNDPGKNLQSNLSPYIHFGQISPLRIVDSALSRNADDFIEQVLVRRELALNFIYYNDNYDSLEGLPDWAKKTMREHKEDKREYDYSRKQFENSRTHDKYWNAAQREMVLTGKMHGYMRMYWGKKIIEWTDSYEKAYDIMLNLNNKYELDGRDPNGFTGVLWCFGKHDRAFRERPVLGKLRYMSRKGLERKFDMDSYIKRVNSLDK